LIGTVRGIRNARVEYDVEAARYVEAIVQAGGNYELFDARRQAIETLARVRPLTIERTLPAKPQQALAVIVDEVETYLPLAGMVNLDQERERIGKEMQGLEGQIASLRGRLSNEGFVSKAPPAVVEKERERLQAAEERLGRLRERLASLNE
jgi:valyl-tRNA synthetase